MTWQDYVMVAGQVGFFIALWPALLNEKKRPPWTTSLMTALILTSYVVCLSSFEELAATPLIQSLVALQWYALFLLEWRKR